MEILAERSSAWCSVAKAVTFEITRKDMTRTTKKEVRTALLRVEKIMKSEFNKVENKETIRKKSVGSNQFLEKT